MPLFFIQKVLFQAYFFFLLPESQLTPRPVAHDLLYDVLNWKHLKYKTLCFTRSFWSGELKKAKVSNFFSFIIHVWKWWSYIIYGKMLLFNEVFFFLNYLLSFAVKSRLVRLKVCNKTLEKLCTVKYVILRSSNMQCVYVGYWSTVLFQHRSLFKKIIGLLWK